MTREVTRQVTREVTRPPMAGDDPRGQPSWTDAERALSRRLRVLAGAVALLFPLAWTVWQWPFGDGVDRAGTPMGGDFPVFYVAARLLSSGHASQLYDFREQFRVLHELFPALAPRTALPFLYPPFVATLVRPLGAVDYAWAFGIFTGASILLWWCIARTLTRTLTLFQTPWRPAAIGWLVGAPLLWEVLLGGQASIWACAIVVFAWSLVRAERWVAAGFVLALAAYKPNALAFVGIGLVVRHPRLIAGGLLAAVTLPFAGWIGAGAGALPKYLALSQDPLARSFIADPPFEKYHGIANTVVALRLTIAPQLSLVMGAALAVWIGLRWRRNLRPESDSIALASLIATQAIFNPYLPIYDLLLAQIGALFLADALVRRFGVRVGAHSIAAHALPALLLVGPHLSQAVAGEVHFQWFSAALLSAVLWLAHRWIECERDLNSEAARGD